MPYNIHFGKTSGNIYGCVNTDANQPPDTFPPLTIAENRAVEISHQHRMISDLKKNVEAFFIIINAVSFLLELSVFFCTY